LSYPAFAKIEPVHEFRGFRFSDMYTEYFNCNHSKVNTLTIMGLGNAKIFISLTLPLSGRQEDRERSKLPMGACPLKGHVRQLF